MRWVSKVCGGLTWSLKQLGGDGLASPRISVAAAEQPRQDLRVGADERARRGDRDEDEDDGDQFGGGNLWTEGRV